MVEALKVEATGPSISQEISATKRILKWSFFASSFVNKNGDPSPKK